MPRFSFFKNAFALALIASILICELAGVVGSLFTVQAIPTWYAALAKPALNPPSWVFGPAWTILYTLMSVAAWRVYEKRRSRARVRHALTVYALQLALNVLWSLIFFGLHAPAVGLAVIAALWTVILLTLIRFYHIDRLAALLFVPYLAWVTFAMYLNFSVMILN